MAPLLGGTIESISWLLQQVYVVCPHADPCTQFVMEILNDVRPPKSFHPAGELGLLVVRQVSLLDDISLRVTALAKRTSVTDRRTDGHTML